VFPVTLTCIARFGVASAASRLGRANGLDIPDVDNTFYDMTEFRIEDPDSNCLWIGQPK